MKIITLYDNQANPPFKNGWGFSVLINFNGQKILFDTGKDEESLIFNANLLAIEKQEIKYCFISHNHYDHTGGLPWLDEKTKIFFPKEYKNEIKDVFTFNFEAKNNIVEQALVIKDEERNFVFVGCSHPGIKTMVKKIKEKFGQIYFLMGGFHLFQKEEKEIKEIAKEIEPFVDYVSPSHCTGERGKEIFEDVFKDRYIKNYVGRIIET